MLTARHHPCQALADLLTLREAYGELAGLRLAYVGDGNNVARSLAILGSLAGLDVAVASPEGYPLEEDLALPPGAGGSITLHTDPREAVAGAGAVYTDVWVSMGDEETAERAAPGSRRLPRRRRAARRRRAGSVRDARPARAPRRGDHRRGPLRRAPAHLGSGREPPPRAEGAARAAGRRSEHPTRFRPGRSAATSSSCRSTRWRSAARAWRGSATAATSCSSPARSPATACARSCTSASAATPTRARSRCSSRAPSGSRRWPTTRASPGRCSPTSASSRSSTSRSTRRSSGSATSTASSSRRSCRRSNSGATATSSSTPSATGRRRARLRLPRAGRGQRGAGDRGLPARLRARQPRTRVLRRAELVSLEQGAHGLGARRPRLGAAREREQRIGPAADGRVRLRNLVVREGRRTRQAAGPDRHHRRRARGRRARGGARGGSRREPRRRAVDALATARPRRRGRRHRARLGRGRAARAARRARPADLRRGVLPDQHRDGRGCSTGSSSTTPRSRAGSASTTSTAGSARSR